MSSEYRATRAKLTCNAVRVVVLVVIACRTTLAADALSMTRTESLATLLPLEQAQRMSDILPLDQQLRWHVRVPPSESSGVLVFVKPDRSADPQSEWARVLDQQNLIWVCAEDFGNDKSSAQRVLAAVLGLALVQRDYSIDSKRIYIGGMSGGGRVASMTITKFPHLFTGALYIVGVDSWTRVEEPLKEAIAANRYVFITGREDFNRAETRRVYDKYRRAGVESAQLIDLPSLGHEYPDADTLTRAIRFLDGERATSNMKRPSSP